MLTQESGKEKYTLLLRILDKLRGEAFDTKWAQKYAVGSDDPDETQQARSRAYIHLYLKVMFGISDFEEREGYVTDGADDGGIDGYYIDAETRRIFLIQSKFRNTPANFEQKEIDPKELLSMDIDRITKGNKANVNDVTYNGKIQGLIRKLSETRDIARYSYEAVILANCTLSSDSIFRLIGGFASSVFNFERSYNELVFPIISGTYFKATDVAIQLDLTNKSAGAKTEYTVKTPAYFCDITVLFVPTIELARVMDKYRNSILEYNPRSYLEFREGKHVIASIRDTLSKPDSNEFALMNNGITILSDETNLSERIGQHNKAQLRLLRPQIINGGQTAYTLARMYNENRSGSEQTLNGKEVLVKIITMTLREGAENAEAERARLIDEISDATNRQSPVASADRKSEESKYIKIQRTLFENYGLIFERKRGEFSDGVASLYIYTSQIIERNLFIRIFLASQGKLIDARRKKIFADNKLSDAELSDTKALDAFADGYQLFKALATPLRARDLLESQPKYRETMGKVYLGVKCTDHSAGINDRIPPLEAMWEKFVSQAKEKWVGTARFLMRKRKDEADNFSIDRWIASQDFESDLLRFVDTGQV
ncbi:MAG: AIPR family protein [Methylocystis sp.]